MKKIILIAFVALFSVFSFSVVKAGSFDNLWERFMTEAAKVFGGKLAERVQLPSFDLGSSEEEMPTLGVAGDTFTSRQVALTVFATGTAVGVTQPDTVSTTIASMLNPTAANGGRTRRITRMEFMTASSTNTLLGGPLRFEFGTSTNQYTTSSAPMYTTAFTTSTGPVLVTTSTANGVSVTVWQSIWKPGEYAQCATNRNISSTEGYCLFEYVTIE